MRGGKVNRNFTENRAQLKIKGLLGEHKTRQINKARPVLTRKSILMWGKKMDIKMCYWFWRYSYTQVIETQFVCMWETHDRNLLDMALFAFSSEKILTWLWDNTYFIAIENSVFFLKQRRKKAFFLTHFFIPSNSLIPHNITFSLFICIMCVHAGESV